MNATVSCLILHTRRSIFILQFMYHLFRIRNLDSESISMQVTGDGFKTPHLELSVERRIRMGVRPKALLTELNPGFPIMSGPVPLSP